MDGLLGWLIHSKMTLAGAGVLCMAAAWIGKKQMPKLMKKLAEATILEWMDPKTQDPVERELIREVVLAHVRLAEYKIPDGGLGEQKHLWVRAQLGKVFPQAAVNALDGLIESAVLSMDVELKEVAQLGLEKRKAQEIT